MDSLAKPLSCWTFVKAITALQGLSWSSDQTPSRNNKALRPCGRCTVARYWPSATSKGLNRGLPQSFCLRHFPSRQFKNQVLHSSFKSSATTARMPMRLMSTARVQTNRTRVWFRCWDICGSPRIVAQSKHNIYIYMCYLSGRNIISIRLVSDSQFPSQGCRAHVTHNQNLPNRSPQNNDNEAKGQKAAPVYGWDSPRSPSTQV